MLRWSSFSGRRKFLEPLVAMIFTICATHSFNHFADIQFTILSKKDPFHPASVANTLCDDIRRGKNGVLPASSVRPSARRRPSRSKQRSARTEAGGQQDTIST